MNTYPTLDLLVPSKLLAPQPRSFWVHRERLVTRLAAIDQTPVTVVVAPAGFGKSTLVAQWIQHIPNAQPAPRSAHPTPVAWLTLDEHDQNGLRFLTYVAGAIERASPHKLIHTLPLLAAQEPPPLYLALHAFLVDLNALPDGLILILDDYHTVTAPEMHQVVTYLLRHLPPACHIVILSRVDPPLALARLRAEQHLTEIRAFDLRFTRDETAALLTNLFDRTPTDTLVSSFQQETEGWAIALQLAALAHQEAGKSEYTGSITRRRVADYLAEEVFEQQPESTQAALLTLAVPERFCAELYAALRNAPDDVISAEEQIRQLRDTNLLLVPLDDARHWYRFHPLFRDLLLRRLRQRMSPTAITALELHTADWLVAAGLYEEAVRHYLAAGAATTAAEIVESLLLPALGRDRRYAASAATFAPRCSWIWPSK